LARFTLTALFGQLIKSTKSVPNRVFRQHSIFEVIMRTTIFHRNWLLAFLPTLCFALIMGLATASAQDAADDAADDTEDDAIIAAGVAVDADGVLQRLMAADSQGVLARERAAQALATLDADIAKRSELRKVSLTRLARLIKKSIDDGHGPDEAMKHLAGLTRIKYAFYYPETQDIVIAGPAEGWMQDLAGRPVGIETGQPVLELQDMIVAMRAFPAGKTSKPLVYCSIDATDEGLARMQQFLSQVGTHFQGGIDEQFIVNGLRESLGLQVITVGGVSAKTHFAQVMVEADYRMKLIGIGLEEPAANIRSYISLANFASMARNAMVRWWFVPDYQRIMVSEDGLAAEFVGNGVKLVGEDEVVAKDGVRRSAGSQNRASEKFTQGFTSKYGQLADRDPVYAQLRNCIDMLIVAALMQHNDFYGQAGWDMSVLGDEKAYPVETYNAPKQVQSAVNSIWKGQRLATPVGGGVQVSAADVLKKENLIADEKGSVDSARKAVSLSDLPADKWWWD
jgi:hypothetical protein